MDSKALSLLTTEELASLRDGLVQVVQNLKFLEALPDGGAEWKRQFNEIEEHIRLRGHRQNLENERRAGPRAEPQTNEPADEILQGIRGIVLDDRASGKGKVSGGLLDAVNSLASTKKPVPIVQKKSTAQTKDFKKEAKKPLVAIMIDSEDEKELEEKERQEEKAYEKRSAKRFLIEYAQKTSATNRDIQEQNSKGQQSRLWFTGRKPNANEVISRSKENSATGSNHQITHPTQMGKRDLLENQANKFASNQAQFFGSGVGDALVEESDSQSEDDDGEEFGQFLDEFGSGDVEFDENEENEGLGGIGGQGFHGFRYWNEGEEDYENEEDIGDDYDENEGEGEEEGFLGDIQPDSFSKYRGEGGDNIDFEALD